MDTRKNKLLWLIITLLSIMLFTVTSCEPMARFQIRNDTNQTLKVFVAETMLEHIDAYDERIAVGAVEPGQVIKFENIIGGRSTYLIEARDADGNIVFSKEFTKRDLDKIDWKVVISTSQ